MTYSQSQNLRSDYLTFLESKIKGAPAVSSTAVDASMIHPSTKPHQRDGIVWAFQKQRALIAMSFGLGKTQVESELARLILDWQYVYDDASIEAADTPFLITNYERVRDGQITPALHSIAGVSLDEGSIMRSLGSKTFDIFQKAFRDVAYRFVATATPSPNSYRELIYYADFLGVMDRGQALTRWFKRNTAQAGDLQLHPQHEADFWLWVSTWALFLYSPADMGYDATGYELPELRVHWHRVPVDHTRAFGHVDNFGQHKLLISAVKGVSQSAKEKRATLPSRIAKAQEILAEAPDKNWLLWHTLEDERRAIEKEVPESVSVYGSLDLEIREQRIIDFSDGKIPRLATKPELSGSGCNFQHHCHSNIFVGIDYKFEDFIQAIHRTQRFQQEHPVDVHIIYAESEQPIADVLRKKWEQHNTQVETMRSIIRQFGLDHSLVNEELKRKIGIERREITGERFRAIHNDCVLEMANIADDSVGLVHTSIPFSDHYEYTCNYEDFGHNDGNEGFFAQMDFLIPELLRVLKPGRVAAIHVKDRILYSHQTKSGLMEVDPFSDLTVQAFMRHGFLYEGRRTITTDVVRENASTYRLGYTEMTRDASKMGSGLPEYLVLFRKAPTSAATARADEPVTRDKADYTRARWQVDAHAYWRSNGNTHVPSKPEDQVRFLLNLLSIKEDYDFEAHVARLEDLEQRGMLPASFFYEPPETNNSRIWSDVQMMRGLNSSQSRREQVQHTCPLPFDIVERVINLYSNRGDVVLDPFAGIFTVPYCAIKAGRFGIGMELGDKYFDDGARYCHEAENEVTTPTLFDLLEEAKGAGAAA
jgi:DNA modification methylase